MANSDDPKSTDDRNPPTNEPDVDPLVEIAARLAELKAFVAHLADVKVDQARLKARRMLVGAIVGSLLGVVVLVVVAVSTLYIARGTALGLSEWFGDRPWLGYLVAGLLLITLTALAGLVLLLVMANRKKQEIIRKYEARRDHQEAGLGYNVDDVDSALAQHARDSRTGVGAGATGDDSGRPADA